MLRDVHPLGSPAVSSHVREIQTVRESVMKIKQFVFYGLLVGSSLCGRAFAQPAINIPISSGTKIVSGTSAMAPAGTTVQIFVCIANTRPAAPQDCSTGGAVSPAAISNPAVAGTQAVAGTAAGTFSATLVTPLASGQYVWLSQVMTVGAAAAVRAEKRCSDTRSHDSHSFAPGNCGRHCRFRHCAEGRCRFS